MTENLGNITLHNGDSREILPTLQGESIDLVVTSPPYDDMREYNGSSLWNFDIFTQVAIELERVLKPGGVIVWIVGDVTKNGSESGISFRQALYFKDTLGLNIHDTMIYMKKGITYPSHVRYHQIFEFMFILSKGKPNYFNAIADRENSSYYERITYSNSNSYRQKDGSIKKKIHGKKNGLSANPENRIIKTHGKRYNVWEYTMGHGHTAPDLPASNHPAMFPIKLATDHIVSWCPPDGTVMDPLSGSGTVVKACHDLSMRGIGIEIDTTYHNIAVNRIKETQKQLSLFSEATG